MFDKLRRARSDLTTMNALLPEAERLAHADGVDKPGAEHLVLAALDLDDIAAAALRQFGVNRADLEAAVAQQHDEALRSIEVVADDNAIAATLPIGRHASGPYRSEGSLQAAFQQAVASAKRDKSPLHSGHILLAATDPDHGTVARVLQHLGIDVTLLHDHVRLAIARSTPGHRGRRGG